MLNVVVFSVSFSDSTSKGCDSSRNWLAVVTNVPSFSVLLSSFVYSEYCRLTPSDARPRPAVRLRSVKNAPKLLLARSTVPRLGLNR
jgi:hypothetical protein